MAPGGIQERGGMGHQCPGPAPGTGTREFGRALALLQNLTSQGVSVAHPSALRGARWHSSCFSGAVNGLS